MIQIDAPLFRLLGRLHGGTQTHGQHHHVKFFFQTPAGLINIPDHLHVRLWVGFNIGDLRLDEPNPRLLFGPVVILLKIFAERAHIDVKHRRVQSIAAVLLGQHGLLDGVGTAHTRTVTMGPQMHIPGTDTLEPGNLLGLFMIRRPYQVTPVRTRGR